MSPFVINGLEFRATGHHTKDAYNVFLNNHQVAYVSVECGHLKATDENDNVLYEKHDEYDRCHPKLFPTDEVRLCSLGEVATAINKQLQITTSLLEKKAAKEEDIVGWLSHVQHQIENRLISLYFPKRFTGGQIVSSKEKIMVRFREVHPVGRFSSNTSNAQFLTISISPEFHYAPEIPRTHEQNMNAIAMRTAARDALCNEKLDGLMEVLKSLKDHTKVPSTTVVDYDYSIECTGGHLRLIDRLHLPGLLVRISQDLRYFDLVIEPKVPTVVIGSTSQDNLLVLCDLDTKTVPTGQGSLTIKKTDRPVGVKEAIAEGNDVMRIEFSSKGGLDSVMKLLEEMRKEWTRQERELTKGQRLD